MKPLLLKMTSFGPFIQETIDFSVIAGKGIFLISGDTGSGKTTIFDAISIALFGESSGDERTAASFKSDYEHATEQMKIEYTFEIDKKIYRVVRVPRQIRKKLRGEGLTDYLGDASLYSVLNEEEVPIAYDAEVTLKVQEILGVEAKQFRQLVMIPQGQFRKLITEKSDEREKVLKKLFDVEIYQHFQKKLEIRSALVVKEMEELKQNIRIEIEHLKVEDGDKLKSLKDQNIPNIKEILALLNLQMQEDQQVLENSQEQQVILKTKLKQQSEQLEIARKNNALLQNFQEAKELKAELALRTTEMKAMKGQLKLAEAALRITPFEANMKLRKGEWEKQNTGIQELKDQILSTTRKVQLAKETQQEFVDSEDYKLLEKKKEELMRINIILPKVQNYQINQEELKEIKQLISAQQGEIAALSLEEESYKNALLAMKNEAEVLKDSELKLQKITNQIEEDRRYYKHLDQISKSLSKQQLLENEFVAMNESIGAMLQKKLKAKEALSILQERYVHGQASFLAANLRLGEACPVCGSIEHPNPNMEDMDAPSKDEMQGASKALEFIDNEMLKEQSKHNRHEQSLEHEGANLRHLLDDLMTLFGTELEKGEIGFHCEELKLGLIEKNEQTKIQLSEFQNQITRKQELTHLMKQIEVSLKEKELTLQQLCVTHQGNKDAGLKKQTVQDAYENEIVEELRNEALLRTKQNELKEKIRDIEETTKVLQKELEENKQHLKTIETRLQENQKSLFEKEEAWNLSKQAFFEAIQKARFTDADQYLKSKISEADYKDGLQIIEEYEKSTSYNEKNLSEFARLLKGVDWSNLEVLVAQTNNLQEELEQLQKITTLVEIRMQENKVQGIKLNTQHAKLLEKMEDWSVVNDLNLLANGKGKIKVTFERYILATFLEDIVRAANIRLYPMTNGRFEMLRMGQTSDRRKNTGLDLEVFDYYTGKARDINTLSGGESFKAALSLALGLSDIACSHAGGISLETMFIDEGFGSLSSEALDSAINCLMELNGVGRLVGIISHVTELKERIDSQLVVEKTKLGSVTHFIL